MAVVVIFFMSTLLYTLPLLLISSYFHFFWGIHSPNPIFKTLRVLTVLRSGSFFLNLLAFAPRAHDNII